MGREPLSVSGIVPVPTKRSLVAHGKRTAVGIWHCSRTNKKVAGGTWEENRCRYLALFPYQQKGRWWHMGREPLSVSGIVPVPTKRSLVAPGSHTPRTTPSSLWVSDVSERMLKTKYFTAISK